MLKKIDVVVSRITSAICYVSYVAIVAIMLLTVADVFMRKVLLRGILGSYELVERMLLIMIFAAFAFAQTQRGHVHVTLFITKFPRVIRMLIFGILGLLSTGTAVFCGIALIEQVKFSFTARTVSPVLLIPLYPFFAIAMVCMFVFAITLFWDTIKSFAGIKSDELAADIQKSWD